MINRLHDWIRFEQDRVREINDHPVRALERRNGFLQKSGNVEERADEKDDDQGRDGERFPDELSGLEGVTDRHESTGCHGDSEPGARQDERVDDRLSVDSVEQTKVVIVIGETSGFQKHVRQDGDADEHVRHGESHEAVMSGLLHALHGIRQTLPAQDEQV